nr:hypothetical protein BaRGS_000068 [Batillaria attramentaria]
MSPVTRSDEDEDEDDNGEIRQAESPVAGTSARRQYKTLEQSKGRHANHEKAIDLFQQAHDVATANYKQGSQETVDTALALAQAYANTGREEAEGLLWRDELARLLIRTDRLECYNIEQLVLGKNHRKTKDTLRTMELLMSSPGISNKFVLNTEDELQKRPRFNSVWQHFFQDKL